MARLLGLVRGEWNGSPREITSRTTLASDSSENGWLIRFFDSAFFCEWIAVCYLYKHEHSGVRDYLCNRMYTLPLPGIESYLFQICYLMVHKPSPSLDKFVIDICSKSLKIAMKVHWFLLGELEDLDDNEGISRIQEKCQIAATLMGEWPPLVRPPNTSSSIGSKNQVLNKILSSKQRLLSLTSSPATQKSVSFSPSSGNNLQEDGSPLSPNENKIFRKLIPGPKVRDALLFRKSVEKDEDGSEKDGFFRRLLRDSKGEDEELTSSSEGFFKRLLRDNKGDVEELTASSEGLFKRLFRDSKKDSDDKCISKSVEDGDKEGIFRKIFKEKFDDRKDGIDNCEDKRINSKNDSSARYITKSVEDDDKGFIRKFLKGKFEDKKDGSDKNEDKLMMNSETKCAKNAEVDEKEGFFKKIFKEIFDDKKDATDKGDDGYTNGEEEEPSELPLFHRLFRVHPEDNIAGETYESSNTEAIFESSPGTESFFRKLFRDRDRSIEDSELFSSKKHKEKYPDSSKCQNDKSDGKRPLPSNTLSQFRKGAYHGSLDFVQSLCDTSYGLVDVFPTEDRKAALLESLAEINLSIAESLDNGGICFPIGKGLYRVVHIPEDEAILLNSREKAPYMICVEVVKCDIPRFSNLFAVSIFYAVKSVKFYGVSRSDSWEIFAHLIFFSSNTKDTSGAQKLSKGGIPLANGDALLPKPPPWAYPLWTVQEGYRNSSDRMSSSTAQAIDQAMTHKSEAKGKLVNVSLSVQKKVVRQLKSNGPSTSFLDIPSGDLGSSSVPLVSSRSLGRMDSTNKEKYGCINDLEWVRVVLTADPGVRMEDIEDQVPPRRRLHRRVPSTIAIEEVKAAAAKGEAPPGLPLKGAGQDASDSQPRANDSPPTASDALSGELWEKKKERLREASAYGKLPGWDLCSVIVKSGDDCRQEHLAVQLISHFYDIFQEAGLPLWLRPYEVLVTSSYTALIETIPNTASIHSIKSRYPNILSLREFFVAKYQENSPAFKLAQRNFVESMAGYSVVCYLLQVKDRHNGNLLLDEEGHIIHIDFGFMLSNSPGGVNFESAPFKLTRELLEVMDSDAEGVPSEFFDYFKVLCIQGFLTCRKHAERIILLAEMLQDSGFPCFKGGPRTIHNLRKRFHLSFTEEQCVSLVLSLISSSLDAWRTRQYDCYQKVLNGIL